MIDFSFNIKAADKDEQHNSTRFELLAPFGALRIVLEACQGSSLHCFGVPLCA
jgi:hypothetical protein